MVIDALLSMLGFPPGDTQVCEFLIRKPFDQLDAYKRCHAFLISLFRVTHDLLAEIADDIGDVSPTERQKILASGFREYMNADQTFEKHGQKRTQFYNEVIQQANEV